MLGVGEAVPLGVKDSVAVFVPQSLSSQSCVKQTLLPEPNVLRQSLSIASLYSLHSTTKDVGALGAQPQNNFGLQQSSSLVEP